MCDGSKLTLSAQGLRAAKHTLSGSSIDSYISGYKDNFVNIRRAITEFGVLEIEVKVVHLLSNIGTPWRI